jgi:hypothetical protein
LNFADTSPEIDIAARDAAFAYSSADYRRAVELYERCKELTAGSDSVHECRFETALGNCKSKLRRGDEEVR